jgi:cell division protein FtsZ
MRERINFTPDYGVKATQSIIKVIGVGGGGGNAVKHMYKEGIIGVDFLICNTDRNALEANPIPSKLVLGESGLGAGANPEVARQLALESREKIIDFLGTETKMLFITAGMGKGTGTGAAPVVAEIAKELGFLTIAVVTMPFHFEGKLRMQLAEAGVVELRKYVDSIIIIKNENLFKHYNKEKADTAFGYADDVLKNAVKCIAELVTVHSEQNIDFNDINTILKQSGSAMLAIAEASGENRIEIVLDQALHCPLLAEEHISNAKNFLFSISYGSEKVLLMDELKVLTDKFNELISKNAHVIWGRSEDPTLHDKIKLSVIISKYSTDIIDYGAIDPIQDVYEGGKQKHAHIVDKGTSAFSPSSPLNMTSEFKDETENVKKEEDDFGFLNKLESYEPHREVVAEPVSVSSSEIFNHEPKMIRRIYDPIFEEKTKFKELIEVPTVHRIRMENKEDFQDKALKNNLTSTFMTEDDVHDFFKSLPD